VCERESKLIIISFVNCSHSQLESKSFTESKCKSFNQLMYYLNIRPQHLLSSSASVISPKKRKPKPKKNIKVTKRTKPAKRCQERQPTIIRIYLLTPPPKENASASPLGWASPSTARYLVKHQQNPPLLLLQAHHQCCKQTFCAFQQTWEPSSHSQKSC
jgi:hypothetical protein